MQLEYLDNDKYGFMLSQIHTSSKLLLTKSMYKSLLQSDSIEDIVIKLQSTGYSSYLKDTKITDKKDLIKALDQGLKKEFMIFYEKSDCCLKALLTFFLRTHQIESFIYRISNPEEVDEELGFFVELLSLKFAKSFKEIYSFIIKDTFLKKYFKNIIVEDEIEQNNMQIIKRKLLKYHLEDFYNSFQNDGLFLQKESEYNDIKSESLQYMDTVLKTIGSLSIIEIVLNTIHTKITPFKRMELFPTVNDLKPSIRQLLSNCTSIDDLRNIIQKTSYSSVLKHKDLLTGLHIYFLEVLYRSFTTFNDLTCVFCYFQLKEQEIKNISWVIEFMGNEEHNAMENIHTVD
ncbi:Vacuolar H+-ATPase V0 sector, subunit d [Pseudoloma neurophilia]|uniref:Vacuolar H+-ATPase V0 sector, subunit d n=1 Tax=Pseudoloma neurophilia TaxID=146866 RepID=A0A0R0M468_9MICR|nr:Vacuolar H+-ATPase V0 sector, subunit d [Pseudoloma neurophilia]